MSCSLPPLAGPSWSPSCCVDMMPGRWDSASWTRSVHGVTQLQLRSCYEHADVHVLAITALVSTIQPLVQCEAPKMTLFESSPDWCISTTKPVDKTVALQATTCSIIAA